MKIKGQVFLKLPLFFHPSGHNWGSEHDPDNPECSPSASQGGSYLMYTYSVSGYDLNNKVNTKFAEN